MWVCVCMYIHSRRVLDNVESFATESFAPHKVV
jgi:bacterioferritin-associated ferredoxin